MILHVAAIHEKKKSLKCNYCDYDTAMKYEMKDHVASVHKKSKVFVFRCEICDYKASAKSYLKKHIVLAHDGEKLF